LRAPARAEGKIEAKERELDADHVGRHDANRFLQQFLPRLVALEDDNRSRIHRGDCSLRLADARFG
jgi:hypothetical protein